MSMPIVAIVGRPNVGKSTLFNKLTGKRTSIVDDTSGVTRDRIYGECEWLNKKILLVDTGGIEPKSNDVILKQMKYQAQLAIDTADVIIFVTDLTQGVLSSDIEVANMLQRSGKPVVLCVNKCDSIGEERPEFYEFYNLGLSDPIAVSSVHGHGTGDLLDAVFKNLNEENFLEEPEERLNIAIIGKPNVGKSSLINYILGEDRCIVSNIAGTTRDAIDSNVDNKYGKFTFIDTAGIRRKSKINDNIEKYSIIRASMAIERSDVCIIMIDATKGDTTQDTKIVGMAHEAGKACILAINKWDAIKKDNKTAKKFKETLKINFSFMDYAPVIFISAKTGLRVEKLFEFINSTSKANSQRINTGVLNDLLARAVSKTPSPTDKGKRLKIYYMTQASIKPPTFVCFVNSKKLFHFSYKRYIENKIREEFDMVGTPIRIIIREKEEKNL